jgi:hypothetical protein
LEGTFKKGFGIDHHAAGIQIIMGEGPNGLGKSILHTLEREEVDPKLVITLIGGNLFDSSHNFLFRHPINIDTMEAISRAEIYLKPNRTSPTPEIVLEALLSPLANPQKLDEFWNLKDRIYCFVIQGALGIFADHICIEYMVNNFRQFSYLDFFRSERNLRKAHPQLFASLELGRRNLV